MKAAVVFELQQGPVWADFADPQADEHHLLVDVRAAAISHVVKGRASGKHYSFDGRLPFVVGIDGAGTLPDGQRVYFAFPRAPWGSMAQRAPVAAANCLPLPDTLDDVTAAAMANPGMSAWAALVKRAGFIAGETVLINGATGSAGQLAIQIARYLGAKKVIATGRNAQTLAALDADVCINLSADDATLCAQFAELAQGRLTSSSTICGGIARTAAPGAGKKQPRPCAGTLCPGRLSLRGGYFTQRRGAAIGAAAAAGQRDRQPVDGPAAGGNRGDAAGRRGRRVYYRHHAAAAAGSGGRLATRQ
nr:quinone oxidoreductase [Raoultella sp. NCTC 9187]